MGRPLDPTVDHSIALAEAVDAARRHRQDGSHRPGDSGAFNAKPILALLAQSGCVGMRFYRGRDAKGADSLVLVGVDKEGNDMTAGLLVNGHMPCPPFCPDDNDLNT